MAVLALKCNQRIGAVKFGTQFVATVFFLDVDECLTGQAVCGAGEKCVNTLGSYTCVCPPGTRGAECTISE